MSHSGVGRAGAADGAAMRPRNKPLEYVIDPGMRLVVVRFGTRLSARDIGRYALLLQADSSFKPQFSEIVDLSAVEQLDLQGDDFPKLADKIDPFSSEAKRAFVVQNKVQEHAARMHKILLSERNVEIFRSMEDAERWVQG